MEHILSLIRDVPDFPKPGIIFKDITPVLADPKAFEGVIGAMEQQLEDLRPDKVIGIEARGFIFGAALSQRIGAGFIPVRKPGKLPSLTDRVTYELEYGTDALEMHVDALSGGEKVLIVDDLLATGGTAEATASLVRRRGAEVAAFSFVIELGFLEGRSRLGNDRVVSLFSF